MNEWMNELTNEWMIDWLIKWIHQQMSEIRNEIAHCWSFIIYRWYEQWKLFCSQQHNWCVPYVDIRHTMIPHPDPTCIGRFYIPLHKSSCIAFRFARERVQNAFVKQTKQRGPQKGKKWRSERMRSTREPSNPMRSPLPKYRLCQRPGTAPDGTVSDTERIRRTALKGT